MSNKGRSSSPDIMEDQEIPIIEPDEEPTSTRQISLVERLELNFPASRLSPNAIILGDIDNDPSGVRIFEKALLHLEKKLAKN
jgi:hypothetical protein